MLNYSSRHLCPLVGLTWHLHINSKLNYRSSVEKKLHPCFSWPNNYVRDKQTLPLIFFATAASFLTNFTLEAVTRVNLGKYKNLFPSFFSGDISLKSHFDAVAYLGVFFAGQIKAEAKLIILFAPARLRGAGFPYQFNIFYQKLIQKTICLAPQKQRCENVQCADGHDLAK